MLYQYDARCLHIFGLLIYFVYSLSITAIIISTSEVPASGITSLPIRGHSPFCYACCEFETTHMHRVPHSLDVSTVDSKIIRTFAVIRDKKLKPNAVLRNKY